MSHLSIQQVSASWDFQVCLSTKKYQTLLNLTHSSGNLLTKLDSFNCWVSFWIQMSKSCVAWSLHMQTLLWKSLLEKYDCKRHSPSSVTDVGDFRLCHTAAGYLCFKTLCFAICNHLWSFCLPNHISSKRLPLQDWKAWPFSPFSRDTIRIPFIM